MISKAESHLIYRKLRGLKMLFSPIYKVKTKLDYKVKKLSQQYKLLVFKKAKKVLDSKVKLSPHTKWLM